ncbi:probable phosphatase phospho2 isoform X1 [Macrosteles quadrilineatus]|uniref:probable phosphatase phospho2 isoform X1 n=2 Tax=Macrosteles quadrilineatus TaxID=74068 RepID=UPI0023E34D36|nr:probable phosphatase phospho2 isoform X1 [Macrosteles quadrilineatus]
MVSRMTRRILVALDFDHTIVEENSDIVARKLIHSDLIPDGVRRLYQTKGWTEYMSEIFKILHKNKISKETIVEAMHNMTPTQKMPEFLKWLNKENHEAIIISDSNSVFIDVWLRHRKLDEYIARVFTNPASFNEDGLLLIKPYHEQDSCKLSTRNLCKGAILEAYIKERQEEEVLFDMVAYVGDGQNDLCPALRLSKDDVVFPRIGFTLDNILKKPKDEQKVIARVRPWISAAEFIPVLQN